MGRYVDEMNTHDHGITQSSHHSRQKVNTVQYDDARKRYNFSAHYQSILTPLVHVPLSETALFFFSSFINPLLATTR